MFARYRRFKKNTSLRKLANPAIVKSISRSENTALAYCRRFTKVEHTSRYRALCHIGVQKTGSVWFREMLRDLTVYRYSGRHFVDCSGGAQNIAITTGIYSPIRKVDDETVNKISQPDTAVVAVFRNPVSLILSWVKSTEGYHVSGRKKQGVAQRRQALKSMNFEQKINYALEYFVHEDRFLQMERLLDLCDEKPLMVPVRYEDCVNKPEETFAAIFRHLDIRMPGSTLKKFIGRHSFRAYSGRSFGESTESHSALQGVTDKDHDALSATQISSIFRAAGPKCAAFYGWTMNSEKTRSGGN